MDLSLSDLGNHSKFYLEIVAYDEFMPRKGNNQDRNSSPLG